MTKNDTYQAKNDKLTKCRGLVVDLLGRFSSFSIQNLPRKDNWHVDSMVSAQSLISLEEGVLDFQFMIHTLSELAILHDTPLNEACLTYI